MRVKLGIGVILLLFLICSMVTVFAAEADKTVLYENEKYGFKVEYPEGWMVKEGFVGSVVAFISTDFNFNVTVVDTINYPNMTLEICSEAGILESKKVITDFQLISDQECTLSGNPARRIIFDGKQGVYNIHWVEAFTLYNNKAYIIAFGAKNTKASEGEELAKRIFSSFTINQTKQ